MPSAFSLPDRRKMSLGALYFCLGIQLSVYDYAMRKDLEKYNVSMSMISVWMFGIYFPWFAKFVPALASDYFGVNGYHRKPYMIIGNCVAAICMLIISNEQMSAPSYIGFFFLYNLAICLADVNYDACIVKATREEDKDSGERGSLQSFMIISREVGNAIGDCMGPLLWKEFGSSGVYQAVAITCFKAFVVSGIFYEIPDKPRDGDIPREVSHDARPNICALAGSVKKTLSHSVLRRIYVFNLVTSLFPSAGLAMFYYLTGPMKFTPEQMSALASISAVSRVLGNIVYRCIRHLSMRRIYCLVGSMSVLVSILPIFIAYRVPAPSVPHNETLYENETRWENETSLYTNSTMENRTITLAESLGLNNFVFAVSDDTFDSLLAVLRNMPVLVVAAIVCEKTVEAGAYATIMSSFNVFTGVRRLVDSAFLSMLGIDHGNFSSLWILTLICMVSDLLSLIASLLIIPDVRTCDVKAYDDDGNAMAGIQPREEQLRELELESRPPDKTERVWSSRTSDSAISTYEI